MGADGWRVRQWQQLPAEAVEDLTNILVDCEAKLAFPEQVLINEVILIGKPAPATGDRPITLTCSLYR
eukprot:5163564-Heterocapsa_arctica.AAC.1